jgi:hypothetical protein
MANSKISALTSAATVVGTEVLPIVQSSATVKATVANLTPGLDTITAAKGGTGQTSFAVGDLLYANTTTTIAKLADVATGNALISGGVGVAPSYGKIGLTTHVSGTLPTANGGTNLTSFTANGVVYASSTSALATGSTLVFDGTNLGVGVSPTYKLDLYGASGILARFKSSGSYASVIADNSSTTGGGYFSARQNGTQYSIFGLDGAIQGNTSTDTAIFADGTGSSIKLYTNGSSTSTARLSSSVNGIFTVGNQSNVSGLGTDYGTIGAWGSSGGGLRIYRGTGAGASIGTIYADASSMAIQAQENVPMTFNTNATERMRIAETGFLALGSSTASTSHLIKATNTTNNGVIFTGANSVLNDGTLSVTIANATMLMVADNNVGTGALFFCGYASATITLISDPSSGFATSITAGRICCTKSANSSTVTITNKTGGTKSITFSKVSTSD